jgi:hypothetical protein
MANKDTEIKPRILYPEVFKRLKLTPFDILISGILLWKCLAWM